MDWFAYGLPRGGEMAARLRAGDVARRDVPTCRLDEARADVARRVGAVGWDLCVVVDEADVVLGVLESAALHGDDRATVQEAMRPGPSTLRPHLLLHDVAEFLARRERQRVLITFPDGRLAGLVTRADVERHEDRVQQMSR